MNKSLFWLKCTLGSGYRALEETMQSWNVRIRTRYAYHYKYTSVEENVILYEAFYGRGMLCNPYAIFLGLLNDSRFSKYQHVWVLKEVDQDPILLDKYKNYKNIKFIKYQSGEYIKYLCKAKYLINNSTFPDYFIKKEGQIYINTWHGIPLKTLGFDMPNGATEVTNVLRNFMQTDYMISASPFLTNIYKKAYKLDEIYLGAFIEEGYPRLDILFSNDKEKILEKLQKYGVRVDRTKKIILYAPTWRGASFAEASTDIGFCFEFKQQLESVIDNSQYQILIKVHQQVYELAKDKLTEDYFVPAMIDANDILSVTDILVSDFSSIYFDFLATNRPVLFYVPDKDLYSKERGLYKGLESLPGPCADTCEEIGQMINNIDDVSEQYQEAYLKEKEWSNADYRENISEKIIDIIFNKNEENYNVSRIQSAKKHILISRGKMRVNGISTSFLNLLENIDYEKFDVSVMVTSPTNKAERSLISRINSNVRVFCRNSGNCMTILERARLIYYERMGVKDVFDDIYKRDVQRSYGNLQFDYVIDFDGYNEYYSLLALQFGKAYKCIWQHSDMKNERDVRFPWLDKIFLLYKYYNNIVSCSEELMQVNKENLSECFGMAKCGYVRNFININRVEESIGQDVIRTYNGEKYIEVEGSENCGTIDVKMIPYIPERDEEGNKIYRFVTVGRCSIEKNHESLIYAFSRLYEENKNVYLYILGDGQLKNHITQLINTLNLNGHVIMPGNIENPFCVLERCDCFILPSLHEGQPMVINEARILKLPIIVSDFDAVRSILVNDGQIVIGKNAEDIYDGMKKFIEGKVPSNYHFDPIEYNETVYDEFLHVLNEKV